MSGLDLAGLRAAAEAATTGRMVGGDERCRCGSWHLGHPKTTISAALRARSKNAHQARRRRTR